MPADCPIPEAGRHHHVQLRMRQRYGIEITLGEVEMLEREARSRGLVLHAPLPPTGSHNVVANWQGRAIVCVLDGDDRALVTVLPPSPADIGLKARLRNGVYKTDWKRHLKGKPKVKRRKTRRWKRDRRGLDKL